MIIFWRGWGILGAVFLIAGAGIGTAVAKGNYWAIALSLLAGAAGCWFLGQHFNTVVPKTKIEQYTQARRAELTKVVNDGLFHLGPGHAAPQSLQEAHAQADQLLAAEVASLTKSAVNRHTLMFIPLQYWGYIGAGLAVLVALIGIFR